MPPQTADTIRASANGSSSSRSGVRTGRSGSPKFVMTPARPQRLAMATPFHCPSPWWASSYPAFRNASRGASASASLVSCISRTSGRPRSSHQATLSKRALSELTFQVAILTDVGYRVSGGPAAVGGGRARGAAHPLARLCAYDGSVLRKGERVGDWIVEAPLGEGGMGAVYRVHSALTRRLMAALKAMKPSAEADARARFVREAEALSALRHPAIVRAMG